MKKNYLTVLLILVHFLTIAQNSPQIDLLYRNSYAVFELQRLPNGMYRDSKLLSGTDYHPISIANTGMGLIALCIADSMGWIPNAEQLVLATLKSVTGNSPGFSPDRTVNGYYRHFMDVNTGAQAWNSEYSTIDTDILVCGALFCMKYFQSNSITQYTMDLWNSINFDDAIANPTTGQIYLTMNDNGTGNPSSLTSPYNEYMIAAWLAKNYSTNPNSLGNILWNNHYNSTNSLPTIDYNGISVLSDNGTSFLSSFTHQFNYYLCHHFTNSNDYLSFFENSQQADSAWWSTLLSNPYEWGLGAGSAVSTSYHADAINNNSDQIVSPHIIAGYLPIYPNGKSDLINLWNNNLGKYELPLGNNDSVLWRYSKLNTIWIPNEIIGVDYASMLFGLSTLPEYLGNSFFSTYNDFFPLFTLNSKDKSNSRIIKVYPNPVNNQLTIQFDKIEYEVSIQITNITGHMVYNKSFDSLSKLNISLNIAKGIYFVNITNGNDSHVIKIQKQ